MSNFQLALLLIGLLVVAAVVAYNWWQERKFHQIASKQFTPPKRDALLDSLGADELDQQNPPPKLRHKPNAGYSPSVSQSRVEPEIRPLAPIQTHQQADQEVLNNEASNVSAEKAKESVLETSSSLSSANLAEEVSSFIEDNEPFIDNPIAEIEEVKPPKLDTPNSTENNTEKNVDERVLPDEFNDRIDLVAVLYLPQAIEVSQLSKEIKTATTHCTKLVSTYYYNQRWFSGSDEGDALRVAIGLQMADRAGPINQQEINQFHQSVESFAAHYVGQVEWQSHTDAYLNAVELDQFCLEVDKLIGFHLYKGTSGPFTGTKLRGLLEAGGLSLGEDGAFHYYDLQGNLLYSIVNTDPQPFSHEMLRTIVVNGITFQMDIPRVPSCGEVFNQMTLLAKHLESSLGATLVDDNQRAIGDLQMEKIRQQLKMIQAKMLARGVVPGSEAALRLFS